MRLYVAAVLAAMTMMVGRASAVGFAEVRAKVTSGVTGSKEIYDAMIMVLGADPALLAGAKQECGLGTGASIGPKTQACVRRHAEALAEARADAARMVAEATMRLAPSSSPVAGGVPAGSVIATAVGEYGPLEGVCTMLDMSQYVGMCDPVQQNVRCVPDTTNPLVPRLSCVAKSISLTLQRISPRADGSGEAFFKAEPQKGTLQPAPLPWQTPPVQPPGTCDGWSGKLLCWGVPTALVAVGSGVIYSLAVNNWRVVQVNTVPKK